MAKITSKNNSLLRDSRNKVSPKVYNLLMELVNDDREELAEIVLKIDYLIEKIEINIVIFQEIYTNMVLLKMIQLKN